MHSTGQQIEEATMVLKSDHEKKLLEASKTFDSAISNKDVSSLTDVLAKDAILHHDGITRGQDIVGSDNILGWLQSYPNQYDYTSHEVIAGAVDEQKNAAFSFFLDQGVKPSGSDSTPSIDTVGIWHHVFDSNNKIKEIWFLRQLSHDELESKMKEKPSQMSYDWSKFKGSSEQPSEERAKKHDKAANTFNDIWRTGDPSSAKDIMADDVVIYDPVMGHETKGRAEFEKMINGFSKSWGTKKNESSVAVSAGDKAFIWWLNSGASKDSGEDDTLYGLNMLVFNNESKITHAVGFRQPTKGESDKLLKDSVKKTGA